MIQKSLLVGAGIFAVIALAATLTKLEKTNSNIAYLSDQVSELRAQVNAISGEVSDLPGNVGSSESYSHDDVIDGLGAVESNVRSDISDISTDISNLSSALSSISSSVDDASRYARQARDNCQ